VTHEELLEEMRRMEKSLTLDYEEKGDISNKLYNSYQVAKASTDDARDKVNNITNAIRAMEKR